MKPKTKKVGWLFRTEGKPPYIEARVHISEIPMGSSCQETFPDNNEGAIRAAEWVSATLSRDDWKLEECGFLGHRIVVPTQEVARGEVFVLFGRHGDGSIQGVVSTQAKADAWKFADNGRDQTYRHVVPCTIDEEDQ